MQSVVAATPGVASVSPAIANASGTTAVMRVYPTTSPQDVATSRLLHHLRGDVLPQAVAASGAKVYVGGFAALTDDFANLLGQRLPLFIGVVILLSFLLLMAVFRSILVPLKAANHELAVSRRRLRRDRDDLPVRLGEGSRRYRQRRTDSSVHPDHDVRNLVRAVDGLRSLLALTHPGGIPAHGQQRASSRRWLVGDRPGDHCRGCDHVHVLLVVRPRRQRHHQVVRHRIRERDLHRRDADPPRDRPVDDGALGRRELVVAGLARPNFASPRRRGTCGCSCSDARRRRAGYGGDQRASAAARLARSRTPSFVYTRYRWLSTVRTETTSRSAIARLARPSAASCAISCSRRVSDGGGVRSFHQAGLAPGQAPARSAHRPAIACAARVSPVRS